MSAYRAHRFLVLFTDRMDHELSYYIGVIICTKVSIVKKKDFLI